MKVSIEGRKQLSAKLARAAKNVEDRVNRAVAEAGEMALSDAMPGVPLEHGELRRSGYVEHRPGEAEVGFAETYAFYVHELGVTVRPEAAPIDWTTPGTGAKYLTGPFLRNRERYRKHIVDAARKGLGDG